jgi:hypothetical protein
MFNFFNKKAFDADGFKPLSPGLGNQNPENLESFGPEQESKAPRSNTNSLGDLKNSKPKSQSDNLKSRNFSEKASGWLLTPLNASTSQSNNNFSNFNQNLKPSPLGENQNITGFNSLPSSSGIKGSTSNNNSGLKNRGPFKQTPNSENFNSKSNFGKTTKSKIKDKVVSITYEEIGLFPRSFSRVFDRFLKQIFSDVENLVIQEYRFYRYLFLTTIQTIFILICVPLVVNFIAKTYLIRPITEYFWNTKQTEIFLNSYEQKRAFIELQDFEEKLYFESLLISNNFISPPGSVSIKQEQLAFPAAPSTLSTTTFPSPSGDQKMQSPFGLGKQQSNVNTSLLGSNTTTQNLGASELAKDSQKNREADNFSGEKQSAALPSLRSGADMAFNSVQSQINEASLAARGGAEETLNSLNLSLPQIKNTTGVGLISVNGFGSGLQGPLANLQTNQTSLNSGANQYYLNQSSLFLALADSLQEKTLELAIRYNNHSIESITNFFADFFSLMTLLYLLISLEIQINITKSFLLEVFFGLDDSKKSLLILIMTDLLVGYHSSNLWELFFQFIFNHYGIPESQTGIFLLVATLPVLLDVLFKYLIFRHLNRSSPATVATYHAIIE